MTLFSFFASTACSESIDTYYSGILAILNHLSSTACYYTKRDGSALLDANTRQLHFASLGTRCVVTSVMLVSDCVLKRPVCQLS